MGWLCLLCFSVVAHSSQALISTLGRPYGLSSHHSIFLARPANPSRLPGRPSYGVYHQHRPSVHLMSTMEGKHHQDDKPNRQRGGRRFFHPIRSIPKTLARFRSRFAAWPKRIKRLFAIQVFMISLLFGYMTQKIYSSSRYATLPPVEVSYSSFLDVLERQKSDAGTSVPSMTNVRIGEDRIQYRLERLTPFNNDEVGNKNRIQLEIPSISNRNLQKLLRQQQHQKPLSYLSAFTRTVAAPPGLIQQLRDNGVSFSAMPAPSTTSAVAVAIKSLMTTFYFLFLYRFYKSMTGRGKSDSPGKLAQPNALTSASFDDIEGIDSAKFEVMELVDALRNPKSYALFGARAPTGLLLVGPPGTGKTMLARATAATAGVPLLYCSGSDFVEMFVGRGAARVRNIFEQARKLSPCIIFIDELDALGKSRDMGGMGSPLFSRSNDEAEQTLNQLLACMDGLDNSQRICVLAATNRREVLDTALVRPGRFDRIVKLELPSAAGRERILRVHCSKLPNFQEGTGVDPKRTNALGKGGKVDLGAIAAVTEGLSGAELEFLVNEAAIRAVRRFDAGMSAGNANVNPVVEAVDFEESVKNFFTTRKAKGGGGIDEMLRGVLRQS